MHVIKSRTTNEFITGDGNISDFEGCHKFASKIEAETAMEVWELGETCRVRRVIRSAGT